MVAISSAVAGAALSQSVKELYTVGKERFATELSKWTNSRNIRSLETKISAYEKVKTIWQRDKFIKLTSFYYPSKINFGTGITKRVESMRDLPTRGSLVIEGTVGQGKSIFLRHLCIQELRHSSSGRIPVFVELRKIDSEISLKVSVFTSFENLGFFIDDRLFDFYAESGRLVLLLDGFDELNEAHVPQVINQLEDWAIKYPNFQVIVTSRPGADIQKSPHFTVVKMAPLAPDDHRPFLSKIGLKGQRLNSLLDAVSHSPSEVKEFLRTPLLLTLLTMVYQIDGAIPATLPDFFQSLFTTVFSKHDATKPGFRRPRKTGLNDKNIELLFESFCFSVMKRNFGVSLDDEDFSIAFEDSIKVRSEKCDAVAFRNDLVKVACLLLEDGDKLAFAHKSLLEYFCASFIKHSTEKQGERIYSSIKTQSHWQPVLQYVSYIDRYKYAKFFGIPKLAETFDLLGIRPDAITINGVEDVIDRMFSNAVCRFSYNSETGKLVQNGLSSMLAGPTIFIEKLFHKTMPDSLPLTGEQLSASQWLEKYPFLTHSDGDGLSGPWLSLVSKERRASINGRLFTELNRQADLLNEMKAFVFDEDKKADDLLAFEI